MCKIIEIAFLIVGVCVVLFGLLLGLSCIFISGFTPTQIFIGVFIGVFFIIIGIGGIWASIYYMKH